MMRVAVIRFPGSNCDADTLRAARNAGAEAIVIGDTPRDILAAHDAGLPSCGVATGRWSIHDLATHGADKVIADFSDIDTATRLLLG